MSQLGMLVKKIFVLFLFGILIAVWGAYAILIRQRIKGENK